jgi:hypothetical protein
MHHTNGVETKLRQHNIRVMAPHDQHRHKGRRPRRKPQPTQLREALLISTATP